MNLQVSAQKALTRYIERIERLTAERKALGADITDIYKEAKGNGFDPAIMRKLISIRSMGKAEYAEQEALLQAYMEGVSWHTTPLGSKSEPQLEAAE